MASRFSVFFIHLAKLPVADRDSRGGHLHGGYIARVTMIMAGHKRERYYSLEQGSEISLDIACIWRTDGHSQRDMVREERENRGGAEIGQAMIDADLANT